MVQRAKRGGRRTPTAGSHQRCWLWGRHVVVETLRAGRWPPLDVHLADRLPPDELDTARRLAIGLGAQVHVECFARLTELCRSAEHQGHLAKMPPYPYESVSNVIARARTPALVLALDGIQDPFNFGAILRSADAFGVDGVLVGETGQAEVTGHVARASAGGVSHLPIGRSPGADGVAAALREAKRAGLRVVGASERGDRPVADCDLRRPTALVIGNEGSGIGPPALAECDELAAIPQSGRVASLNAAVAAGVLLYEARRQRGRAK